MPSKDPSPSRAYPFPATVAGILSVFRIVINRGAEHGVKFGQKFVVYELSAQEIIDPETRESLGHLEITKGTGTVIHVQDKMAILRAASDSAAGRVINAQFKSPKIGDKARPI
jgi:hypothetical protein